MLRDNMEKENMSVKYHLRRIGVPASHPSVANFIHFERCALLIGRTTLCDFMLLPADKRSKVISRCHARIIRNTTNIQIKDSSSTGIYINDIKIAGSAVLNEGDLVTFGCKDGQNLSAGTRIPQPRSEHQFMFERCECLPDSGAGPTSAPDGNAFEADILVPSKPLLHQASVLTLNIPPMMAIDDNIESYESLIMEASITTVPGISLVHVDYTRITINDDSVVVRLQSPPRRCIGDTSDTGASDIKLSEEADDSLTCNVSDSDVTAGDSPTEVGDVDSDATLEESSEAGHDNPDGTVGHCTCDSEVTISDSSRDSEATCDSFIQAGKDETIDDGSGEEDGDQDGTLDEESPAIDTCDSSDRNITLDDESVDIENIDSVINDTYDSAKDDIPQVFYGSPTGSCDGAAGEMMNYLTEMKGDIPTDEMETLKYETETADEADDLPEGPDRSENASMLPSHQEQIQLTPTERVLVSEDKLDDDLSQESHVPCDENETFSDENSTEMTDITMEVAKAFLAEIDTFLAKYQLEHATVETVEGEEGIQKMLVEEDVSGGYAGSDYSSQEDASDRGKADERGAVDRTTGYVLEPHIISPTSDSACMEDNVLQQEPSFSEPPLSDSDAEYANKFNTSPEKDFSVFAIPTARGKRRSPEVFKEVTAEVHTETMSPRVEAIKLEPGLPTAKDPPKWSPANLLSDAGHWTKQSGRLFSSQSCPAEIITIEDGQFDDVEDDEEPIREIKKEDKVFPAAGSSTQHSMPYSVHSQPQLYTNPALPRSLTPPPTQSRHAFPLGKKRSSSLQLLTSDLPKPGVRNLNKRKCPFPEEDSSLRKIINIEPVPAEGTRDESLKSGEAAEAREAAEAGVGGGDAIPLPPLIIDVSPVPDEELVNDSMSPVLLCQDQSILPTTRSENPSAVRGETSTSALRQAPIASPVTSMDDDNIKLHYSASTSVGNSDMDDAVTVIKVHEDKSTQNLDLHFTGTAPSDNSHDEDDPPSQFQEGSSESLTMPDDKSSKRQAIDYIKRKCHSPNLMISVFGKDSWFCQEELTDSLEEIDLIQEKVGLVKPTKDGSANVMFESGKNTFESAPVLQTQRARPASPTTLKRNTKKGSDEKQEQDPISREMTPSKDDHQLDEADQASPEPQHIVDVPEVSPVGLQAESETEADVDFEEDAESNSSVRARISEVMALIESMSDQEVEVATNMLSTSMLSNTDRTSKKRPITSPTNVGRDALSQEGVDDDDVKEIIERIQDRKRLKLSPVTVPKHTSLVKRSKKKHTPANLLNRAHYDDADTYVLRVKEIAGRAQDTLSTDVSLVGKPRVGIWLKEINEMIQKVKVPETIIAVVGDTGSGKSSLMNALLGHSAILPTSGMRACTAVVVEIENNPDTDSYLGEIEFLQEKEWYDELHNLLHDLQGVDGIVKARQPDPNRESHASWCKIRAVYGPFKDGTTFSDLESITNVTRMLGLTRKVVKKDADDFRRSIDHFIAVQGNKTSGQYWPIVKRVRLQIPSSVCSSGAILVDLPGIQDANAARDKIAKSYLQKSTSVWVVANIHRAVDNKTAKELLGENFKRQLLMDGQYGSVSFICTKTDDLCSSELRRGLKVDEVIAPFEEEMKTLAEEDDRLEDLIADLEVRVAELTSALEQREKRLKTYEKERDDLVSAGEKQSTSKKSMKALQLHQTSVECEILDSLTQIVDLKKVIKAEQEDLDLRITERRNLEAKSNIAVLRRKVAAVCSKARNDFAIEQIKNDFKAGLKEMKQHAGVYNEDDEEFYEIELDDNDDFPELNATAANLKVFCVSSNEYLKILGCLPVIDGDPNVFESLEECGIPALEEHVHLTTKVQRRKAIERMIINLAQMVHDIHTYLTQEGLQNSRAQGSAKGVVSDAINKLRDEVLSTIVEDMMKVIGESFSENIHHVIREGARTASQVADDTVAKWHAKPRTKQRVEGGIPWPTYKSLMRQHGSFDSPTFGRIDMNADLTQPMYATLSVAWDNIFNVVIWRHLEEYNQSILKAMKAFIGRITGRLRQMGLPQPHLTRCGQTLSQRSNNTVQECSTGVRQYITDQQREINRVLTPEVQQQMTTVYGSCAGESGTGTFMRMKSKMSEYVSKNKTIIFDKASATMVQLLMNLEDGIKRELGVVVEHMVADAMQAYEPLWEVNTKDLRAAYLQGIVNCYKKVKSLASDAQVNLPEALNLTQEELEPVLLPPLLLDVKEERVSLVRPNLQAPVQPSGQSNIQSLCAAAALSSQFPAQPSSLKQEGYVRSIGAGHREKNILADTGAKQNLPKKGTNTKGGAKKSGTRIESRGPVDSQQRPGASSAGRSSVNRENCSCSANDPWSRVSCLVHGSSNIGSAAVISRPTSSAPMTTSGRRQKKRPMKSGPDGERPSKHRPGK